MPAFKKFGPGDQLDNVLILEPRWNVSSGSSGWHGSPEGSASVTLYGGARRRAGGVFQDIRYSPTWPLSSFGQQVRAQPQTSSINIAWMVPQRLNASQVGSTMWDKDHWDTVMRLYQDYSVIDPDYVTSSYDHYCLYFQKDSTNIAFVGSSQWVDINTQQNILFSSSFAIESWIKPFLTQSATTDFTIASQNGQFWLGITGSTGRLLFSSSNGVILTSSFGPNERRWNHVAFSCNGTNASMFINLQDAGTASYTPAFSLINTFTSSLSIGARYSTPLFLGTQEKGGLTSAGDKSFHGFIGETRFWNGVSRTAAQISSSYNTRLPVPTTGAFIVYHLNDGPFGATDYFGNVYGSGALDAVWSGSANYNFSLNLESFNDNARPVWHPNDNMNFFVPKNLVTSSLKGMLVVDIPSAFYGRQISPNSISMTCRAYSSGSYGLVRTIVDDGRGNLYLSGSACSSTLANKEDYAGVAWNKVGNVFYGEGLIVIRDPSLLDFGGKAGFNTSHPNDQFQLSFRGTTKIPVKTLMCRIDHGELNATSNQTFWTEESDDHRVVTHPSASLRITTVGVYNSDRELVGVACLAEPIKVRPRDRFNIKLKMDF